MVDPLPVEIDEMIRTWADHAAVPFQGKPRSDVVENGLRLTIQLAFGAVGSAIPSLDGVRFGFVWDADNRISVAVEPKDEVTEDMLIIKVSVGGPDANGLA